MLEAVSAWKEFYSMAGGAIAALTGLLFVAMSLHMKEILANRDVAPNVTFALYALLVEVLLCGFMLVPGITLFEAGAAVTLIGLSFTAAYPFFGGYKSLLATAANVSISLLYLGDGNSAHARLARGPIPVSALSWSIRGRALPHVLAPAHHGNPRPDTYWSPQ